VSTHEQSKNLEISSLDRHYGIFSMIFLTGLSARRMVRAADESFFKHLIDQKEKEIVKLWEQRIQGLEEKVSFKPALLSCHVCFVYTGRFVTALGLPYQPPPVLHVIHLFG
jgi:hypothetical protein